MDRKLGRLPPTAAAGAVPRLAIRRHVALAEPPASIAWTSAVRGDFDPLGNNDYGDCAFVAPAQLDRIATACAGNERRPTEAGVLGEYAKVTGWSPDLPGTDNGAVLTDVLSVWKGRGLSLFGFDKNPSKILGYVRLNPQDLIELRWGIAWFCGLYLGWNLPAVAMSDDPDWTLNASPAGLRIVGGHATATASYGPEGFHQITWGEFRRADDDFTRRFLDEAYAVVMEDWKLPSGLTPSGLDAAAVEAHVKDLAALSVQA